MAAHFGNDNSLFSPDGSGILFLAFSARKRYSGQQDEYVLYTWIFLLLKNKINCGPAYIYKVLKSGN